MFNFLLGSLLFFGFLTLVLFETILYWWNQYKLLRNAIRNHRSQKADDRCIEDDDILYAALGDGIPCDRRVGNIQEMHQNCWRFLTNRCQEGGWKTYVELEKENQELLQKLNEKSLS